ncbi:hypothetical protein SAMN06295987_102821 [Novosphingobium mathurense]|uniref:Uncharacterized protein n=1 Tax=Novosphingobium mathurense TaxID=428990 RepID=A0A1U6HNF0_9SPHN|nr:hypothetical protein SAMN06295987_102821 [Novosphingobium mathurense]
MGRYRQEDLLIMPVAVGFSCLLQPHNAKQVKAIWPDSGAGMNTNGR